jgi:8-hydroxy-5-deazaflavin:NADPH oxidoreductase
VNIGIIGSGNIGAGMGKIWAAKGHKVLFSFSKDQEKLRAVAAAAGPNARAGTPAGAVAFGELILLSVPWSAVPKALRAAGDFEGKTLLEVGTSAAEEIVKLAPGAKMVEAIPPMAQILAADSRRLDGRQISAFYCGNDPAAKASVASLLRDLDLDPVDAGPLTSARYIELAGMLCVQLAYGMGMGPKLAMKLLRDRADAELSYV